MASPHRWGETCKTLGFPGLHFHDLRHTGNTLAQTGTSLRDLMTRMGHDSPRAALIYQHASSGADRAIADALDLLITATTEKLPDQADCEHDQGDKGPDPSAHLAG
jgi:integrase